MKYIINLCLIMVLLLVSSCSDDDNNLQVSAESFGNIITPNDGQSFVLNPFGEQSNIAMTVTWDEAEYSVQTPVTYLVEVATPGTNFENPIVIGSTTSNNVALTVGALNGYAVQAGITPFSEGQLDLRVKASIGTQSGLSQFTETKTISVTPFTTDLPKIAVPGNHQGWDPPTAPLLASSAFGETDYEGYVWLDGGYKFLAPDATGAFQWGNTDWGDDGNFDGHLVEDGEEDCTATAGYYFLQADTDALTYSATSVSWGIIGAATPTGWDSDTDLVYNSTNKTLEIDIDLVSGPFKFRGNNEWGQFDLGTVDDDGFLQFGGDLTFNGPDGNYHVVLDLSTPREYTYTLTQN